MIPWTFEHNLVHKTTEGETTANAQLQHWLSQFPVLILKAKCKTDCQRKKNNVYFIDSPLLHSPSILPMFCAHLQPPRPGPAGFHAWEWAWGREKSLQGRGKVAQGKPPIWQGAQAVPAKSCSVYYGAIFTIFNIHNIQVAAVGQKDSWGRIFKH